MHACRAGCSVQLPDGATVTNFTSYWFDGGAQDIKCRLFRYKIGAGTDMMASADSSGSAGSGSSLDWSIEHHTVDNGQYAYYISVELPAWPGWPGYWFAYVIIGYEYQ